MVVLKYFLHPVSWRWKLPILCPSPNFSYCVLGELMLVPSRLVHRPLGEINSQQTCGASNCEELLSNNPALPVGEMVIKQQILKSILEFVYEMQLDLAAGHYRGSFVLLCHILLLEGGPGFVSTAYVYKCCMWSLYKCFWGTCSLVVAINYGFSFQEITVPSTSI